MQQPPQGRPPQGPPPGGPTPPGGAGGSGGYVPPPRQKPATMATYKRMLRKEINRKRLEPEINFLNITAMMDMMTIILVFLLKSMSLSIASGWPEEASAKKSLPFSPSRGSWPSKSSLSGSYP